MSLASRALALEEGRIHRLGQQVQRKISRRTITPQNGRVEEPNKSSNGDAAAAAAVRRTDGIPDPGAASDRSGLADLAAANHSVEGTEAAAAAAAAAADYATGKDHKADPADVEALRLKLEALSGEEIRDRVSGQRWETAVRQIGVNADILSQLERDHPEDYAEYRRAQLAAEMNILGLQGDSIYLEQSS